MSVRVRTAQMKYRQTDKGRAANSRCSKKHYYKNKQRILAKRKEKVECFFCGTQLNRQYFMRTHYDVCPYINS